MSLRYFLDHTVSWVWRTWLPFNSPRSPKKSLLLQTLVQYVRICSALSSPTDHLLYLYWHTSTVHHARAAQASMPVMCDSSCFWASKCWYWKIKEFSLFSDELNLLQGGRAIKELERKRLAIRLSTHRCIINAVTPHPEGLSVSSSGLISLSSGAIWILWDVPQDPFRKLFQGYHVFILNCTSKHTTTSSGNQKTQLK